MKYSHLSETAVVKKIKEENNLGVFHVEGLYPGYGVTLGNSLRRTLLSSLPGAAISRIKIKGVDHEFSTLNGMMEDVVEFTLNLKKIRFNFYADEPQVLKFYAKGEREIKASDIQSTTLVKVVNPDLHIGTLTKKSAELDAEVTVEKGLGYVPSDFNRIERLPVGTIVLDAIFSPVVRVEFTVENMRVGDNTDYNRLKLEIETDGSISPSEALHKASNILKDHFEKVSLVEVSKIESEEIREAKEEVKKKKTTKKSK